MLFWSALVYMELIFIILLLVWTNELDFEEVNEEFNKISKGEK